MDRNHSRIVIALLAGILFVMLVGREAARDSLETLYWAALPGVIVVVVAAGIWNSFRDYIDTEVLPLRYSGKAWLYKFVLYLAGLFFFGSLVVAGFLWLVGSGTFQEQWDKMSLPAVTGLYLWIASGVIFCIESLVIWFRRRDSAG